MSDVDSPQSLFEEAVEQESYDPPGDDQPRLFDEPSEWERHWVGMPEFIQENLTSSQQIIVHFENYDDVRAFAELVGQRLTPLTKSIWYPAAEIEHLHDKRYVDEPAGAE